MRIILDFRVTYEHPHLLCAYKFTVTDSVFLSAVREVVVVVDLTWQTTTTSASELRSWWRLWGRSGAWV